MTPVFMILRVCVVIPCFDHPRTISEVVKDVVNETPFPILLIDDGSETPVANVLYSFEVKQALEEGRVRVVRFETHQGRGAALQYAVQYLVGSGYTHMLTFDPTGAFSANEISKLANECQQHPWDLIVGNRGLDSMPNPQVGWRAAWHRVSRRLWRSLVQYETGSQIQDSRSGLRLYPLFPMQCMHSRTKHRDWELEILIRLLWSGVGVREVDVRQWRPHDSSHPVENDETRGTIIFNRMWRTARLWALNATLITISLLRTHAEPRELALAMGLGVFVGCTPAYGFHTLIVAILAVTLRMNFIALWVGTHISTPVLFPLLFLSEVYVAQHWFGIPASNGLMGHFYQWMMGSLVLGIGLGLISAFLTYFIARSLQAPVKESELSQPSGWRLFLLNKLGVKAAYAWAHALAFFEFFRHRPRRGLAEYYKILQPKWLFWERQRAILAHLRRAGELEIDSLASHATRWVRQNKDLQDSSAAGLSLANKEALIITAHIGNWKMAAGGRDKGIHYVDRLRESQVGELIPFLGKLAFINTNPFLFAAQSEAPVVISFGIKTAENEYTLYSQAQRFYEFKSDVPREQQLYDWASRFANQLEFFVRRYPEQWMNLYPFWSTIPSSSQEAGVFVETLKRDY